MSSNLEQLPDMSDGFDSKYAGTEVETAPSQEAAEAEPTFGEEVHAAAAQFGDFSEPTPEEFAHVQALAAGITERAGRFVGQDHKIIKTDDAEVVIAVANPHQWVLGDTRRKELEALAAARNYAGLPDAVKRAPGNKFGDNSLVEKYAPAARRRLELDQAAQAAVHQEEAVAQDAMRRERAADIRRERRARAAELEAERVELEAERKRAYDNHMEDAKQDVEARVDALMAGRDGHGTLSREQALMMRAGLYAQVMGETRQAAGRVADQHVAASQDARGEAKHAAINHARLVALNGGQEKYDFKVKFGIPLEQFPKAQTPAEPTIFDVERPPKVDEAVWIRLSAREKYIIAKERGTVRMYEKPRGSNADPAPGEGRFEKLPDRPENYDETEDGKWFLLTPFQKERAAEKYTRLAKEKAESERRADAAMAAMALNAAAFGVDSGPDGGSDSGDETTTGTDGSNAPGTGTGPDLVDGDIPPWINGGAGGASREPFRRTPPPLRLLPRLASPDPDNGTVVQGGTAVFPAVSGLPIGEPDGSVAAATGTPEKSRRRRLISLVAGAAGGAAVIAAGVVLVRNGGGAEHAFSYAAYGRGGGIGQLAEHALYRLSSYSGKHRAGGVPLAGHIPGAAAGNTVSSDAHGAIVAAHAHIPGAAAGNTSNIPPSSYITGTEHGHIPGAAAGNTVNGNPHGTTGAGRNHIPGAASGNTISGGTHEAVVGGHIPGAAAGNTVNGGTHPEAVSHPGTVVRHETAQSGDSVTVGRSSVEVTLANGSNPSNAAEEALKAQGVTHPTQQQIAAYDNLAGRNLFSRMGQRFSTSAWYDRARHLWIGTKLYFPRLSGK